MSKLINRRQFNSAVAAASFTALSSQIARGQATPLTSDLTARLDAELQRVTSEGRFSGAALIQARGQTVLRAGYGYAEIFREEPNTPETAYQIASLTKAFTALAIAQLAEAGRLDLDAPVAPWLPEAPHLALDGVDVTPRMLLSHTAGVPDFLGFYDVANPLSYPRTFDQLLADIVERELEFVPGTAYRYGNSAYIYAGLIIERVAGQTYEAYLREHILEPAGMTNTWLVQPPDPAPPIAVGYGEFNGQLVGVSAWGRVDLVWAAGGLSSTVDDLLRWHQALQSDLLASRSTIDELYRPVMDNYGLGWETDVISGHTSIGHEGHTIGYDAKLARFLDDDALIILLSNRQTEIDNIGEIGDGLAAILFG